MVAGTGFGSDPTKIAIEVGGLSCDVLAVLPSGVRCFKLAMPSTPIYEGQTLMDAFAVCTSTTNFTKISME